MEKHFTNTNQNKNGGPVCQNLKNAYVYASANQEKTCTQKVLPNTK